MRSIAKRGTLFRPVPDEERVKRKRTLLLLPVLAGAVAAGCAARAPAAPPGEAVVSEATSWREIGAEVIALAEDAPGWTLVVSDIDNTLLRPPRFPASYAWYEWQIGLPEARRAECLLDVIALMFVVSRLEPMEPELPQVFDALREAGARVTFLTARNPGSRPATERELRRNHLHDADAPPRYAWTAGWPRRRQPAWSERPFSFANGIAMASGQDKGRILAWLLSELELSPALVVFVDDEPENVRDVKRALEGRVRLQAYHYDGPAPAYPEAERRAWLEKWPPAWRAIRDLVGMEGPEGRLRCPGGPPG